jgi:hypothetical protein
VDYSKFFTTKRRTSNNELFVCCTDEAPEQLKDLIHEIHRGLDCYFPNDWIYEVIAEAFSGLEDDDIENVCIEADIYNADLLEWAQDGWAQGMIDEATKELGRPNDFIGEVSQGQWYTKDRIYHSVNEFMEKQENEDEEEED